MRKIASLAAVAVLSLAACSGGAENAASPADGGDKAAASGTDRTHDVSGVQKVDEIAALVPEEVAKDGKLTIGASIDYAPAEFRAEDLQTAIGYEVDFGKAIGKVLGLEAEVVHGEFAGLLPGIGSKYDVGISAFTITDERVASYNMIAISEVGSSFAVKKGNPTEFSPEELCGTSIAVQNGTWQHEDLDAKNKECTDGGKEAINVLVYGAHSEATTNVVGGKADAFYADSTVSDYAVELTNDQLEVVGDVFDSAPQGIVVPQDDAQLTEAMQKAAQHLMDDGTYKAIMESWGTEGAMLTTAELHTSK